MTSLAPLSRPARSICLLKVIFGVVEAVVIPVMTIGVVALTPIGLVVRSSETEPQASRPLGRREP